VDGLDVVCGVASILRSRILLWWVELVESGGCIDCVLVVKYIVVWILKVVVDLRRMRVSTITSLVERERELKISWSLWSFV